MVVGELFVKLGLIPDKNWAKGHILIGGITKAVRALVNADTVHAIKDAVNEVVELGGKLQDTADATQTNVEELQELGYAASQSGGDFESVAGALGMLTKNMYQAANGNKAQAEAFAAAGIAIRDEEGKLRPAADVMEDIAEHLSSLDNESEKMGVGVELMGKKFQSVAPMMFAGREEISKLRKEARDLGVVMSKDDVGALDNFGDDMGRVKAVVQGLKQQFVVALIPALQKLLTGLLEWMKANRELARETVTKVASALATALGYLGKAIVFVVDNWKAFAALLAAGAMISAFVSIIKMVMWFKAVQTRAAIQAVINWIMILGPILLIAAAIVALGVLIYKYRDRLANVARRVKAVFLSVIEWFRRIPGRIKDVFVSIGESIKEAFRAAFEWVGNLPIIKQLRQLVAEIRDLGKDTSVETISASYDAIKEAQAVAKMTPEQRAQHDRKIQASADRNMLDYYRRLGFSGDPTVTGERFNMVSEYSKEARGNVMRMQPSAAGKYQYQEGNVISVGDVVVNTPATDPVAVGKAAREAVREELSSQNRQAVQSLQGGK